MAQRRKLLAALLFWKRLGLEIPKGDVFITDGIMSNRKWGIIVNHQFYMSIKVLDKDMRAVTGIVYSLFSKTKASIDDVKEMSLMLDTLVEFGERILGIDANKRKSA